MRVVAAAREARPNRSTRNLSLRNLRQRPKGSRKSRASAGVAKGQTLVRDWASVVAVCTVRVEVALPLPGLTCAGEKLAVAPEGNPVAVSPTAPAKLPLAAWA